MTTCEDGTSWCDGIAFRGVLIAWRAVKPSHLDAGYFVFDRLGIDEHGKVRGTFRASGIRPKFAERLATAGCRLRAALFESRMEV